MVLSAVPSELVELGVSPGVETPGYSHPSLRDRPNRNRRFKILTHLPGENADTLCAGVPLRLFFWPNAGPLI
jgi:hypothetical protein